MDESSLSHTRWDCKYHIVFIPKYRRKTIYGKIRQDVGQILRQLCDYKGVEIIEAHACVDQHTYVGKDTAKVKRVAIYGLSKREKLINDI